MEIWLSGLRHRLKPSLTRFQFLNGCWRNMPETQVSAGSWRWTMQLSLANFPERCALAPESNHFPFEVRQLLYGKRPHTYRILLAIRGDTVCASYSSWPPLAHRRATLDDCTGTWQGPPRPLGKIGARAKTAEKWRRIPGCILLVAL